jgi:hypothetical protein
MSVGALFCWVVGETLIGDSEFAKSFVGIDFEVISTGFGNLFDYRFGFQTTADMNFLASNTQQRLGPSGATTDVSDHLNFINDNHIVFIIHIGHFDGRRGMGGKGNFSTFLTCKEVGIQSIGSQRLIDFGG